MGQAPTQYPNLILKIPIHMHILTPNVQIYTTWISYK